MKKTIMLGIILSINVSAMDICNKSYYDINKNSKRVDLFMKSNDWDMTNFYLEKLKTNYTTFIRNECFEKVFKKENVKKMRKKYKGNIIKIRNLSEMAEETIKEKNRLDRIRMIKEAELRKEIERNRIRDEVRDEIRDELMRKRSH